MPDFRFSFLTHKDLPQLRETFLKAFADYVVPVQLSEEQLKDKVEREGIEPSFSVGAFVGEEMVGFILSGLGEWQRRPTAYNAGTGVVPTYRGYGLTQKMYAFLVPKLRESGIEQCLLEVIQDNTPALRAYQSIGLHITRSLHCFRALKQELLLLVEEPEQITISPTGQPDWKTYRCLWDVEPTWQNNIDSIRRSAGQSQTLEARNKHQEIVGYISFFRKNGAVAQLAVDEQWRGQGIGTALLREAGKLVEAPSIMFINIEDTAQTMLSFMQRRHFRLILKQYEMLMPIA
ncbi:GNAT family N-acetyltransferase [Pontibacter anaerobius]|uniref:GNAT family N-acetyltransferase n=1 Tax=Pontibacter anaerobius TaxID=2993940 RepID=A0ABT3RA40_9BACT|nr:GNAT family N-acetyltransferase [Pontibacter anaerobius]MCX2738620.1 GNAT family N-acetyltransferase [Pontibacter anaerobius]